MLIKENLNWQSTMDEVKKIIEKIREKIDNAKNFTGQLELNFKDGELKDINVTRRIKF